jgi:decaprenylphospho-beta-D-ribofuranose 2-oxidase
MPELPDRREPLPLDSLARLTGFGMASAADAYRLFPTSAEAVLEAFRTAERAGVQVVLRGAGRSYGDAAIGSECLALDFALFDRILSWDPASGVIEAEPGATLEDLWRRCLPDGWWPPVVSGTMHPTLGGALAMNIHGKNAFRAGTLGEHVLEMDVAFPSGEQRTLTPQDDLFADVISSAGLLGAIVRVKLQMKRVVSGLLDVTPVSCSGWDGQLSAFESWRDRADYMVSWVDAFGDGRGLFHAAAHAAEPAPETLRPEAQDLPERILGVLPKSQVWRFLRLANRPGPMRLLNAAKHSAGRMGGAKPYRQSLVAFSFLLDYVPGWQNAYLPGGFLQYQSFVPAERAKDVFREQIAMQRAEGLENFLSVLKQHRPDERPFLFSHALDGYSLAMDFKITPATWPRLEKLCHRMNDLVLEAGGRFYFAKDSTLRPSDLSFLGQEALDRFRKQKAELDPNGLLTSALAKRVGLSE